MQLLHFYHGHGMHRLADRPDFSLFEIAIWLHTLAHSLISIFVPILLLQTGYSIRDILVFYLVYNLIDVPLNFAVDWLVRKIGARKVLILATFAVIAFFGLLGILPPSNWPLLMALAFLAAAYDTLFWVSHFYIFIEANRGAADASGRVGSLAAVRKLAHIAGPIIGGVLLIFGGKPSLSIASVIIFLLSIVPLYKMQHVRDVPEGTFIPPRQFFSEDQEKRNYLSLSWWGVHSEVEGSLWPLFLFTLFVTVGSVAAVPVIVAATSVAFSYLAGKLTKRYATRMILAGSLLIGLIWILRFALDGAVFYYSTTFLVGLFSLLVAIPIDSSIVDRGLKLDSLSAATYRNAISMSLRIPLYATLLLLLDVFKMSFGIAALSASLVFLTILAFRRSSIMKAYQESK